MKDAGEAARGIRAPVSAVLARRTGARSHKILCQKVAKVYAAKGVVIIGRLLGQMRSSAKTCHEGRLSAPPGREIPACWPQQHGRRCHQGQSSTGWRTMNRHRAVAPRSGLAVCPGNWRLGQGRAGQRGRQLQAADIRLAPDSVLYPDILLFGRVGRTMRGCPHPLSPSRMQRRATGTGSEGMRRQGP